MKAVKHSPCKACRQIMRIWALDARRFPKHQQLCIRTAMMFRDTCYCLAPVGGVR